MLSDYGAWFKIPTAGLRRPAVSAGLQGGVGRGGGVEAGGVEGVGGGLGGGWCVSAVALTAVVGMALVSVRVHSEERLI